MTVDPPQGRTESESQSLSPDSESSRCTVTQQVQKRFVPESAGRMLKASIPVLLSTSSVDSEQFYCGQLGFEKRFAYRLDESLDDPCYMGLEQDGVWLHVSSFLGDGVVGSAAYIIVDDVDALHARLLQRGVEIELPPTDQSWGNRETYVKDPDGNSLRFIQETS